MIIHGWSRIPTGAKRLIIYYTLSSIPLSVYVFFPIYMFVLGFSIEIVGVLLTIYFLLESVSKYIIGRLLDIRLSPRACIIFIDTFGAMENIVYFLASTPGHFLIAFIIASVTSPFFVAYRTIEKDLYPRDLLELTYRHHVFWPYLAQLLGILIMGFYLWVSGNLLVAIRILFLLTALLHFLMGVYVYLYIPETSSVVLIRGKSDKKKHRIVRRALLYFAIAEIIVISSFMVTPSFILQNYLFNVLGFTIISITIIEAINTAFRGLGSILHEKLEKYGGFLLLVFSLGISSLAGVIMYFTQIISNHLILTVIIMISITIMGLGESMWWIQHEAIFLKQVPEDRRGEVFGIVSSARSIIDIIIPTIVALLASRINPLFPYIVYSLLIISAIPFYFAGIKKIND